MWRLGSIVQQGVDSVATQRPDDVDQSAIVTAGQLEVDDNPAGRVSGVDDADDDQETAEERHRLQAGVDKRRAAPADTR